MQHAQQPNEQPKAAWSKPGFAGVRGAAAPDTISSSPTSTILFFDDEAPSMPKLSLDGGAIPAPSAEPAAPSDLAAAERALRKRLTSPFFRDDAVFLRQLALAEEEEDDDSIEKLAQRLTSACFRDDVTFLCQLATEEEEEEDDDDDYDRVAETLAGGLSSPFFRDDVDFLRRLARADDDDDGSLDELARRLSSPFFRGDVAFLRGLASDAEDEESSDDDASSVASSVASTGEPDDGTALREDAAPSSVVVLSGPDTVLTPHLCSAFFLDDRDFLYQLVAADPAAKRPLPVLESELFGGDFAFMRALVLACEPRDGDDFAAAAANGVVFGNFDESGWETSDDESSGGDDTDTDTDDGEGSSD